MRNSRPTDLASAALLLAVSALACSGEVNSTASAGSSSTTSTSAPQSTETSTGSDTHQTTATSQGITSTGTSTSHTSSTTDTSSSTSTSTSTSTSSSTSDTSDTSTTGAPLDDLLTLDHIQVKGTHNSYHIEPPLPFDESHKYTHASLDVQLGEQGVRAFELDVHQGLGGFEVYHISVIDSQSSCDAFTDCLEIIRGWSQAHALHLPIAIWIEIKDSTGGLPIDAGDLDLLDDDIRSVFSEEFLLTPDDIQGDAASVRAALEQDGWPTLAELRGQVYFILLNTDQKSEDYTYGFTHTEGRAMFARVGVDDFDAPWAAVAKLGIDDMPAIDAAHAAQILIATNVCGAGDDDETCFADLDNAKTRGLHMLKDDFPAPVDGQNYFMEFVDGNPARCNPITAPPECTSVALEDL